MPRLTQLKKQLSRKASLIEPCGAPNESDHLASLLGTVLAGLGNEAWPECCGAPMVPVLQLNLSQAPFVPDELRDVAFLALFVDGKNGPKDGAENGDCWQLRSYDSLAKLSRHSIPAQFERRRGRPIRYKLLERDLPDYEDVADLDIPEDIQGAWEDEFGAAEGSKLGGWPSLVQSEIFWAPNNEHPADPKYVFQLAHMERITPMSADTVCYFGRGSGAAPAIWTIAMQTL